MRKSLLFAGGILISLLTILSCQSTKSSTASKMLKFNFENGKGYDYEMNMDIDQDVMGQKIKMNMLSYYSMDVTGAEGDVRTMSTTFDRIKMDMNVGGMDMNFDSDKKNDASADVNPIGGMMNKIFGALAGRKFTMRINAEGKVESIKGFKEMAASMFDSIGLEGSERDKAMEQFNKQFNEEGMKSQFERVLYIFPNKEVKIGDSWEKTTTAAGQMGGNYTSTYTVKEIEGDIVTLEEKSKIDGTQAGMEIKGNVKGLIVVDSKSGLVVSSDQDMNIKISKEGQSFDMKAKNKIKGKAR
jgi:Family of unknown function (DUF6263)